MSRTSKLWRVWSLFVLMFQVFALGFAVGAPSGTMTHVIVGLGLVVTALLSCLGIFSYTKMEPTTVYISHNPHPILSTKQGIVIDAEFIEEN